MSHNVGQLTIIFARRKETGIIRQTSVRRGHRLYRAGLSAQRIHQPGKSPSLRSSLPQRLRHLRQPSGYFRQGAERGKKGLIAETVKFARHKIVLYNNHNEKRPDYPDLFIAPKPDIESPLYWDTDPVKLKELLTALDVDKAISTLFGEKAPFTTIVERFEQFLHVKLGTAAEVKPPEICWPTIFAKPPCRTCPVIVCASITRTVTQIRKLLSTSSATLPVLQRSLRTDLWTATVPATFS